MAIERLVPTQLTLQFEQLDDGNKFLSLKN
jgi:hypothetical protein